MKILGESNEFALFVKIRKKGARRQGEIIIGIYIFLIKIQNVFGLF